MAQTPEAKVKAKCRKLLDTFGAYYFFPATGGYGRSGVPDIVGSYKGRFFAIECKAGNNKPTPLQLNEIKAINDSGAVAIVVNEDNIDDVAKILEKW
jgi:Holliday junction resolvase